MKITVVKTQILPDHVGNVAFIVLSPKDLDRVAKWGDGQQLQVEVKNPRNLQHHNKFRAILSMVADNAPEGTTWTEDKLLNALKEELGYYELYKDFRGTVKRMLLSTSFESMEQEEFQKFYERSLPLLANLIGVTVHDLEVNWEDYL